MRTAASNGILLLPHFLCNNFKQISMSNIILINCRYRDDLIRNIIVQSSKFRTRLWWFINNISEGDCNIRTLIGHCGIFKFAINSESVFCFCVATSKYFSASIHQSIPIVPLIVASEFIHHFIPFIKSLYLPTTLSWPWLVVHRELRPPTNYILLETAIKLCQQFSAE